MLQKIKYSFIIAFLLLLVYSCVKKKTYSQNPQIEYKSFRPFVGDSADMVIAFSDGDGDIGKLQEDKTNNLFMTYYYKDTITLKYVAVYDQTQPLVGGDSTRTAYTIRKPSDDYSSKSISGEVSVRISKYRHSIKFKSIKYVIYMVDNGGHKSNVITTPELIVP